MSQSETYPVPASCKFTPLYGDAFKFVGPEAQRKEGTSRGTQPGSGVHACPLPKSEPRTSLSRPETRVLVGQRPLKTPYSLSPPHLAWSWRTHSLAIRWPLPAHPSRGLCQQLPPNWSCTAAFLLTVTTCHTRCPTFCFSVGFWLRTRALTVVPSL